MKTIAVPSAFSAAQDRGTGRCASCAVSTAVGSSRTRIARAAVQRAQDLHALLHADRDVLDRARRGRPPGRSGPTARARAPAPPRSRAAGRLRGSSAEHDVLGHGHDRDEHEVLVHHADPELDGLARRVDRDRLAVDADLALVGLVAARRGRSSASTCRRRSPRAARGPRRGCRSKSTASLATTEPEPLRDPAQLEGERAYRCRITRYLTVSGMLVILPDAISSWTCWTWSAYFWPPALSLP